MYQIAAVLDSMVLYRYSLILALSSAAGVCFFLSCCCYKGISLSHAATVTLTAVISSLLLSRLIFWYGRPDSFSAFSEAFTASSSKSFALSGAFIGCLLSVLLLCESGERTTVLDCMSLAGCWAISLGRLGDFFTTADRGQMMDTLTGLPWAYPVCNVSGRLEYRFATFLFQSAAAGLLGVFLTIVFLRKKRSGDTAVLFLLIYSATQILLDSTRYDSLYLQCNGFVSIVQILCAVALCGSLTVLIVRNVRIFGITKWMIPSLAVLAALLGIAGYMEYYVQRHGREAAFAYSIMGVSLICITAFGLFLWYLSCTSEET